MNKKTFSNLMSKSSAEFKRDIERYKNLHNFCRVTTTVDKQSLSPTSRDQPETANNVLPGSSALEIKVNHDEILICDVDETTSYSSAEEDLSLSQLVQRKRKLSTDNDIRDTDGKDGQPSQSNIDSIKVVHISQLLPMPNQQVEPSCSAPSGFSEFKQNQFEQLMAEIRRLNEGQAKLRYEIRSLKNELQLKWVANNKLLRENIILSKKFGINLSKFVGDDNDIVNVEMESIFPLRSLEELSDLEVRLADVGFAKNLESFLRRQKGLSPLDTIFRLIAVDEVYIQFNYAGSCGKRALKSLKLYETIVYNACGEALGRKSYESELRKSMHLSHNRYYKSKGFKSKRAVEDSGLVF